MRALTIDEINFVAGGQKASAPNGDGDSIILPTITVDPSMGGGLNLGSGENNGFQNGWTSNLGTSHFDNSSSSGQTPWDFTNPPPYNPPVDGATGCSNISGTDIPLGSPATPPGINNNPPGSNGCPGWGGSFTLGHNKGASITYTGSLQ